MNELQLYISKSTREFRTLVDINGNDNIRGCLSDMRSVVEAVDYPSGTKTLFYAVNNVKDGYMIHVLRTIPPTHGNHLDATIFVDRNIDIMSEDLEEVIEKVSEKVLAAAVTEDDMRQLRELFAREYDSRDKTPKIKPSQGEEIAQLCYGSDSDRNLYDIINEGLYRREWSAYKAVLIIYEDIATKTGKIIDLDIVDNKSETGEKTAKTDSQQDDTTPGHNYVFALPMVTPDGRSLLEFEVESSKPIKRSPIPGYEINGNAIEGQETINRLRRTGIGNASLLTKLLWIAAGVVIGLIIAGIGSLFEDSTSDKNNTAETQTAVETITDSETAKDEKQKKDELNSNTASQRNAPTEASHYLDTHRVWQRDKMEKIDGLKGLYEDLNNYRFDRLTDYWAKQLEPSKNFAKIVKAAIKARNKKTDPRRDAEHNPCYNRDGDSSISWLGYTYWIDP